VPGQSIARSKHRGIKREIVRAIASIRGTVSKPGREIAELRRGVVVEAWGSCRHWKAVAEPWNLGRNDDATLHAPFST
jgi:hypothetical protein